MLAAGAPSRAESGTEVAAERGRGRPAQPGHSGGGSVRIPSSGPGSRGYPKMRRGEREPGRRAEVVGKSVWADTRSQRELRGMC